jgi:hypothetical protein
LTTKQQTICHCVFLLFWFKTKITMQLWSLGQGPEAHDASKEELTSDADIREMMKTLYPVITEQQARHIIADDIEECFCPRTTRLRREIQIK